MNNGSVLLKAIEEHGGNDRPRPVRHVVRDETQVVGDPVHVDDVDRPPGILARRRHERGEIEHHVDDDEDEQRVERKGRRRVDAARSLRPVGPHVISVTERQWLLRLVVSLFSIPALSGWG